MLVKADQPSKQDTPFKPTPYEVKEVKGTMITAENENHQITRNTSHFKKLITDNSNNNSESHQSESRQSESHQSETLIAVPNTPTPTPRKSTRAKQTPAYLKDYIVDG